jgi:hypothetical protein
LSWQFGCSKLDQFCFAFFSLSKIIDLQNMVLNFAKKEGQSLGAAWSRYNQLALSGPELSIPDEMFMHHFVHGLGTESAEYLDMTSRGVFVHCMVGEGKLILDKILLVAALNDLRLKAPHISEEEPSITYPDASEVSTSLARELLQLTAPEISSNKEEDDHTPFPLSIEDGCFEYDIGNLSKAPTCDKKGLFFEPTGQDREEFMVSQENLLRLSAIISRGWSEAVEEDDSYVRIYPGSNTICCCLQGFSFQTICYDPRVGLNIPLLDEASDIDLQLLVPSTKIL